VTNLQIKESLFESCRIYVQQRIDTARQAMQAAQESANMEEKSSAGDKYETGRAMAQLERDRHAQLLAEALKLSQDLAKITIDKPYETVQSGSLVTTDRGLFFISTSVGKLTLDGREYFAISSASPIGQALAGKRAGESATFNRMTYQVQNVS
jgi:transcription elongation GreA/GreB family factor